MRGSVALRRRVALVAPLTLALLLGAAALAAAAPPSGPGASDRFIVVFEESVQRTGQAIERHQDRLGFDAVHRYRHALRGFAARLSATQRDRLARNPDVALVVPDQPIEARAEQPLATGERVPSGVRRIGAASSATARRPSQAGVAVLDTGIDLGHPDLNAVNGINCFNPGASASDDNGHGTHVAGTIGARNNGSGVVGVAPGTRLHAVKVLNSSGDGSISGLICGIDWVTANREALNIEVANMSLGNPDGAALGTCQSTADPLHQAICRSTAAGVNYVSAAGNDGVAFDTGNPDVPAAYPEVLTVTAMSDSDGQPGGTGGFLSNPCALLEADDEAASFSDFAATAQGQAHTIAAPGVCIESTVPGGHDTISGTSMASPHVAAMVALCIDEAGSSGRCAGLSTAQVITQMRKDAQTQTSANPGFGFERDPLHNPLSGRYYGFLTTVPPPPPPLCEDLSRSARFAEPIAIRLDCTGAGPFTHRIVSGPANGAISGFSSATGTLTYRPANGFSGTDSFTYRAANANGESATATVRIMVQPPSRPSCGDVTVSTDARQPVSIRLECAGEGNLVHRLVSDPGEGRVSNFDARAGTLTYTPDADFAGQDSLSYAATNEGGESAAARVSITVRPAQRFEFGRSKQAMRKGTATLLVEVPGPGTLTLEQSRSVRRAVRRAGSAGRLALKVRPRGAAKRRLSNRRCRSTGRRRLQTVVRVTVSYRPDGGSRQTQRSRAKLIRRC